MSVLKKYLPVIVGAAVGAVGGYAYYYWVGCITGSCPITSQPVTSTLYGALLGGLLLNIFQKNKV